MKQELIELQKSAPNLAAQEISEKLVEELKAKILRGENYVITTLEHGSRNFQLDTASGIKTVLENEGLYVRTCTRVSEFTGPYTEITVYLNEPVEDHCYLWGRAILMITVISVAFLVFCVL